MPPKRKPRMVKLSPRQETLFWAEFDAGKRFSQRKTRSKKPWFDQTGARNRQPVWVNLHSIGTVRKFSSREKLQEHLDKVKAVNKFGQKIRFQHFDFVPTQIVAVDRKNFRTLERAYKAPSLSDVSEATKDWYGSTPDGKHFTTQHFDDLQKMSLYGPAFIRRMREKKVSLPALHAALSRTSAEIYRKIHKPFQVDTADTNLIVLDYNPKTDRPKIMLVDHWGGESTRTFLDYWG